MKTRYKITIIFAVGFFIFWSMIPMTSWALCKTFEIRDQDFCLITGSPFFGIHIDTNPFDDYVEPQEYLDAIMKKKATLAFNIKLSDYDIPVEKITAHAGMKTHDEFYMGEAITHNGTRYFLMAIFSPHQSLDTIDVDIYKIDSACSSDQIVQGQGCPPKHLTQVHKPDRPTDYGWGG